MASQPSTNPKGAVDETDDATVEEPSDSDETATTDSDETATTDSDETVTAEGRPGDEAADRAPLLAGRRLTGLVSLLVVSVLLLAAAITAAVFWTHGQAMIDDRENALSAARQSAVNLTTIDYNQAEQDVRRVLEGSTGDFGGLFTQNLDSYVGVVKDGEVVTAGEVTAAGLETFDGETAGALVAVRTTVKNKTVPEGEQRFYRLVQQMEKHDGRWLVARVEFVP
ncbi:hypothetical protein ACQP04_35695 [Pseudonocardia halophobica]|uniref:hypothetical protein n=1 Tax=Pseudonocardia halophobica TaxID=29401 RepID=UPI003D92A521